jgi:hypothetical protein
MQKITDFLSEKAQAIGFYIILIFFSSLIAFAHLSEGVCNRFLDIILLSATFYYGSSKSGATKDATLLAQAQNQQAPIIANSETTNLKS